MFRKIVSNLAFSPALVGQLGFYAKRLRKEEATRRIGLIFVALTLVVQSFAVFAPPESANASNADNIVYSGIRNTADMLAVYDRGTDSAGRSDIKQIYTQFGITRADIANTHLGSYNTNDFNSSLKTLGRSNWGVPNRTAVKISGSNTTIYTGEFLDGYNYKKWAMPALIGKRASDGSWFAITLSCGNLVYTSVPTPPAPKPTPQAPKPVPVASCTTLKVTSLNRTDIKLDAAAAVSGGATIKGYTYTVRDGSGRTVLNRTVATTGTSSSIQHTLKNNGAYSAIVTVLTSQGDATGSNCAKLFGISPAPVASCTGLKITTVNRTTVKLAATATAANGAKIASYAYTIKDAKGAVVMTKTVPSATTSSSIEQVISKDGAYTASVVVKTSIGDMTDDDCTKSFTVSPEPLCPLTSTLTESSPDCKPCTSDESLWYKDKLCVAEFEQSKTVRNETQSIDNAANTTARPGDQLLYTLTIKNTGKATGSYEMTDNIADILEYATVVDLGDGKMTTKDQNNNLTTAVVTWPNFTGVKPGEIIQRTILVKVKPSVPSMAATITNQSYDCRVTNTFGNTLNVSIECPPEKVAEQIVAELPHTGAGMNMLFSGIVLAVVVYFYARTRQTTKEVRLIRRDLNAGTI